MHRRSKKDLLAILNDLRSLPAETEWFEFKEAKNNHDFSRLGKYFSAMSNEANLKLQPSGWIVFGVVDKSREIVGSNYRRDRASLDKLKDQIAQKTTDGITFKEIYELQLPEGRVVMFEVPPAPCGMPVAWDGHFYGRNGESLSALNMQEIEQIRGQMVKQDWSVQICAEATIDDLDPDAILKAREEFKKKHNLTEEKVLEIDSMSDIDFLNKKAKVTIRGKITNTALVLLGREESSALLSPATAQMAWFLQGEKSDYQHFMPPFILNVDRLLARIRNLNIRHLPDGTLFPLETTQYDPWVIREALHNCIAHQDYLLGGRITVTEHPNYIKFSNLGSFLPETVEKVIEQDSPPEFYRNRFLAQAMVNLNMIDTEGGGIKKMFNTQMKRFFPLPDYDFTESAKVVVRVQGEILDEKYTHLLMKRSDLDLWDVLLLDKVQKRVQIEREDARRLRKLGVVEGRYPNLFVASKIAKATGEEVKHIRNQGMEKEFYKNFVIKLIQEHGPVSRQQINELLMDKLPEILTEKQKANKIHNLLQGLSKDGIIKNVGSRNPSQWVIRNRGT